MGLINCTACGHEVSSDAPNCPHCGQPNKALLVFNCSACGKEISRSAANCPHCGQPFQQSATHPQHSNVWAIVALIMGVIGLAIGWLPFISYFGFFLIVPALAVGIVALVIGIKHESMKIMAIIAMILILISSFTTTCSALLTASVSGV